MSAVEASPQTMPTLLSVDRVVAGYGAISVLEGISLQLIEGETVAVLGPNGAGKTTLLRVISGVIDTRGGEVRFAGRSLKRQRSHNVARSGIGHVPEGRAIFPGLSVLENLRLGAFARSRKGTHAELIDGVFAIFPWMKGRLKQPGGTLSGGEQQMLAIARALMGQPRVLLLDEPSLGLSPAMVKRVFEALRQIKDTGISIVVVEQNITHALELADRGYVINRGRVALEGAAAELEASSVFRAYVSV